MERSTAGTENEDRSGLRSNYIARPYRHPGLLLPDAVNGLIT